MNLTALGEDDAGLERLLIEPLAAVQHFPPASGRLLDIGSGGGSPAIPMKLARPAWGLVMVEARVRKSAFLREACRALGLEHATVETARFEALVGRPAYTAAHDVVSVRGVQVGSQELRKVQAFVKPQGLVFLFRSSEFSSADSSTLEPLERKGSYRLGCADQTRLVILQKRSDGA